MFRKPIGTRTSKGNRKSHLRLSRRQARREAHSPLMERCEERLLMSITLTGVPTWIAEGPGPNINAQDENVPGPNPVSGATEALAIEYAEGAKLYVPVAQAHLLTRYVGVGRRNVPLHQLGGKRWDREKIAAERAVQDMAGTLLEIQASRDSQDGFAFPPDNPWQHELEAAFPYQETEDQESAIREVKKDMENKRPMDRLLCGDAGYGKTEVAMRAAFKMVMEGRQVALLVPTTILAQQHFDTFTERMAAFPMRVEMLSRFRTRHEQNETIRHLREGETQIVIGTHRLVSKDVGERADHLAGH